MITDRDLVLKVKEFNQRKEPIWFTKLCEELKAEPHEVMKRLRIAEDWGIIEGRYGATSKNRAGHCLYVTMFGDGFLTAEVSVNHKITKEKE